MQLEPRDRLIVALDVSSVDAAQAMVAKLGDAVSFYKIGYQLAFAGGLAFAHTLTDAGKKVFVDLKLHDIDNTVAQGVKKRGPARRHVPHRARLSPDHESRGRGARGGLAHSRRHGADVHDDKDLAEAGYNTGVSALVAHRAEQARAIGVDGLVCSGEEVAKLRAIVGPKLALVTPGIRPAGSDPGEQKRVATPAAAIAAGADYLVVGRPIIAAADPKAAAEAIVAEISGAQS